MEYTRCRRCWGRGYKGGWRRGKWRIATCRRCGGTGTDPRPATLPENRRCRAGRVARELGDAYGGDDDR